MKITCQSCQAKYTIADEKVAGKTVKIKCKKCGATIVVSGNEGSAGMPANALATAPQPEEDEGDGATRVFSEGGAPGGGGGPDEWTVNVADDDQRTLTGPQIAAEWKRGVIKADTYVWKDGMSDWLPISGVPELMRLMTASGVGASPIAAAPIAAGRPAAGIQAPSPVITHAPAPLEDNGLGGTMIMNEPVSPLAALSPSAAASPAAARRNSSAKAPAVDLFASGQHERAQAAAPVAPSGERQLGERNENSVLFSISALTAAAGAGKGGADPFDLGPSPGAKKNRNSGVDDIMNLGGGGLGAMGGAPMLAPPPLLAPLVEMPAPPPVAAPVATASAPSALSSAGPAMSAVPAMRMDQFAAPPPKSKAPMIIGVVGLLAVLGGAGAFFATRGSGPASTGATAEGTSAPTTTAPVLAAAPTQTPSAAPTSAPVAQNDPQKPADTTQAGTPTQAGAATSPSSGNTGAGKSQGGTAGKGPDPKADAKHDDPKPEAKHDDPKPADTKPPETKPAETKADPGGGGKEFDRAAAMSALSGAAGAARGCKKDDGPTGTARVKVTFAPSGSVTSSSVDGAPFAGTSVGGCIAGAFRGVHVPAFDGSPVTVNKSISIN